MDTKVFGERLYPSAIIERNDKDTNNPAVNPVPFTDKIPVYETPILETPVQETPMVGAAAGFTPSYESPVQVVPIVGTAAVVGPLDETKPYKAAMSEAVIQAAPVSTNAGALAALLSREESEHFRTRWNEIQGKFVDEPRSAVQQAAGLVSEVIAQITQMFATEQSSLDGQWNQGNDVSTEDLRKALQRYRSFFNRLVV